VLLCLRLVNELRTGRSDITAEHLVVVMARANKAAAKQQKVGKKEEGKRKERPARRRRKETDWMAEGEFFKRFDDVKRAERGDTGDNGQVTDSLVDL
jgi:hypothetical protein